jgi:hypothetical protein
MKMQSLNNTRTAFTEAGAELRGGRKEDIRASYPWLLGAANITQRSRNIRIRQLCVELVRHGHYAKPASYDDMNPASYRTLRHGVMSHMFQVWRALPGNNTGRWTTESGFSFRLRQWARFCDEFGYDAESTMFQ